MGNSGGFHIDVRAVVFCKLVTQLCTFFAKEEKRVRLYSTQSLASVIPIRKILDLIGRIEG